MFLWNPPKKSLDSLAGKLNLNWPYSPALPQRPKFKFYFPAKESKDFLAGFIEKLAFRYFKVSFSYLWQLLTFSFGVSSNLLQQKSPTAEIVGIYFLGTIVPRKYRPIIFAVGLFCCEKFEETPNEKVSKLSKLNKSYFRWSATEIPS